MKRFLLATHGTFAEGIYNSLELIMGKQSNVDTICAYINKTEKFPEVVENYLANISDKYDLVVITDLFGGSINNEFMKYIDKPNMYLVTGLNLMLLLELIIHQEEDTDTMINDAIRKCNNNVIFCKHTKLEHVEDEEF